MRSTTRIRSVARAAQALRLVAEREGRTAAELATALECPRPTCYHLLNTLEAEGLLSKDPRRRYHLGPLVGALSDALLRELALPEHVVGALHRLAETTCETAHASGWHNGEVTVLASIEGTQAIRVAGLHRGFTGFANARSAGKLLLALATPAARDAYLRAHPLEPLTRHTIVQTDTLLAELARIREAGYALDEEEFRDGVACVSAAVIENGHPSAVVTVSAPVDRFRARQQELIEAVVATVGGLGTAVAG
jgi:DNA-binding IclR family transcriptional regulator